MRFILNGKPLSLFNGAFPVEYSRYQVKGSQVYLSEGSEGLLLIQQFGTAACQIVFLVAKLRKSASLQIERESSWNIFAIPLQSEQRVRLDKTRILRILETQYNLVSSSGGIIEIFFPTEKEYLQLGVSYQEEDLYKMTAYFPKLAALLNQDSITHIASLQENPFWQTSEIQDNIFQILHCPFYIEPYPLYLDLLTKSLLFHLLLPSIKEQSASGNSYDIVEGLNAAREMIRRNLKYHYTIHDIARKVGMNEFMLKNGFKEKFKMGVYEYLQEERMKEALHLLIQPGRSIKEVAGLTGYKSVNSFIKAFKKKYQRTPGEFKRRA